MTDNNQSKRILIVEDDQFLREFYQELLQQEGYQVDIAADGDVASLKTREGGYDLILLDIMLPKKDGVQVLKDLKDHPPQKSNKSIVVLTNLGQDTLIKECYSLGAEGFLIKSALNPDQVLSEVKNFLSKTAS